MTEHPTQGELEEFLRGTLPGDRRRLIFRHFLRGCMQCSAVAVSRAGLLFDSTPPSDQTQAEIAAFYDPAIEKAFASVASLQAKRLHVREQEAVDRFAHEGATAYLSSPAFLQGLDAYHLLLRACHQVRYSNPSRMIELAALASFLAARLDTALGVKQVADLRARALIELGNAYRVADKLDDAERTLGEAAECLLSGTGDDLLKARLFEIQGTLYADRRLFPPACEAMDTVYAIYSRYGDRHLAGRSLLKKGIYIGYGGEPEEAIRLIQQGLAEIDAQREPALVFGGLFNQVNFLVDCGRYKEARTLFWEAYHHSKHALGSLNVLRLRWIEGRTNLGMGNLAQAEKAFISVREGLEEASLGYQCALVCLDLAAVWLRQGKVEETRGLVLRAVETFLSLKIQREVLAGVLLLKTACEARAPMNELLDTVREYLRRAEHDPSVRFEAWFQV